MFKWFSRKSDKLADEILAENSKQESGKQAVYVDTELETEQPSSWMNKLKNGLSRTRGELFSTIKSVFGAGITDETLEEFEEMLIASDMGIKVSVALTELLREKNRLGELKDENDIEAVLKKEVTRRLSDQLSPLKINEQPAVILMVGINGVGKTTTVAKLARLFTGLNKKCLLTAADTFRAGAVEQLEVWAERLGHLPLVKGSEGQDPASVAFEGVKRAVEEKMDIVLVDTAGRLHTQKNLMEEVRKIERVVGKTCAGAPHEVLMVIDATTGQNAIQQARLFNESVKLSGLVVTKLDGTAKGGIVLAIHEELNIPVRFIGVGEQFDDLQHFNPEQFAEALFAK
jgi:fused signal recognition particle receptor